MHWRIHSVCVLRIVYYSWDNMWLVYYLLGINTAWYSRQIFWQTPDSHPGQVCNERVPPEGKEVEGVSMQVLFHQQKTSGLLMLKYTSWHFLSKGLQFINSSIFFFAFSLWLLSIFSPKQSAIVTFLMQLTRELTTYTTVCELQSAPAPSWISLCTDILRITR